MTTDGSTDDRTVISDEEPPPRQTVTRDEVVDREAARQRFGGTNTGAAFFGWLVAVGMTILLSAIVGAIAAAVGRATDVTQDDAERAANTIGFGAAIVLIALLAIAYFAGGYVAGRMSRFDGGRQGLAVWLIGLVVTIAAVAVGWLFGDQYNVLDRVDLPSIPIPRDQATVGGILTGIVVLALTLVTSMAGGKLGEHYHRRVDRAHQLI
jgi:amino acid transporter